MRGIAESSPTIRLGPAGPIPVNRFWFNAVYPASDRGCCVLEILLPTPTNKKELEEFLIRFNERVTSFRAHCLRQIKRRLREEVRK